MTLRRDEQAMSTVIGAIVILAILGLAVVSVNASYVPRQGEALELAARENAEASLLALSTRLGEAGGPLTAEFALRPAPGTPPLLSGVILSPARAAGTLSMDPAGPRITISHVSTAPSGGVPPNDPMREVAGPGLMRVYDLGNATSGHSTGALGLTSGGAYLEPASYSLEAGALLLKREASSQASTGGPALRGAGTATAPTTLVSWRIPILTGSESEVSGVGHAGAKLTPGPVASIGGGQLVHEVRIVVETDSFAAWTTLLQEAVGARGTVYANATGQDAGTVTAVVGPPPGAAAGEPSVELDLSAIRYATSLTGRSG